MCLLCRRLILTPRTEPACRRAQGSFSASSWPRMALCTIQTAKAPANRASGNLTETAVTYELSTAMHPTPVDLEKTDLNVRSTAAVEPGKLRTIWILSLALIFV